MATINWEPYEAEIRVLLLDEEKPFSDVRARMIEKYDFNPTYVTL